MSLASENWNGLELDTKLEDHIAYYSKDNKQRSNCTVFKVIKDKTESVFGYTVINDRINSGFVDNQLMWQVGHIYALTTTAEEEADKVYGQVQSEIYRTCK